MFDRDCINVFLCIHPWNEVWCSHYVKWLFSTSMRNSHDVCVFVGLLSFVSFSIAVWTISRCDAWWGHVVLGPLLAHAEHVLVHVSHSHGSEIPVVIRGKAVSLKSYLHVCLCMHRLWGKNSQAKQCLPLMKEIMGKMKHWLFVWLYLLNLFH